MGRVQDGGGGYAAGGGGGEGGGEGAGMEFGVDANMDPELAMALRVSLEEERARQGSAGTPPPPFPPASDSLDVLYCFGFRQHGLMPAKLHQECGRGRQPGGKPCLLGLSGMQPVKSTFLMQAWVVVVHVSLSHAHEHVQLSAAKGISCLHATWLAVAGSLCLQYSAAPALLVAVAGVTAACLCAGSDALAR